MKITLNEAQIEALADALSNNPGDRVPDECELEIRDGVLLLDDAYLWSNGDFATYPETPE